MVSSAALSLRHLIRLIAPALHADCSSRCAPAVTGCVRCFLRCCWGREKLGRGAGTPSVASQRRAPPAAKRRVRPLDVGLTANQRRRRARSRFLQLTRHATRHQQRSLRGSPPSQHVQPLLTPRRRYGGRRRQRSWLQTSCATCSA